MSFYFQKPKHLFYFDEEEDEDYDFTKVDGRIYDLCSYCDANNGRRLNIHGDGEFRNSGECFNCGGVEVSKSKEVTL
jgi:hypothetical protein